jgi:hypothetical protein
MQIQHPEGNVFQIREAAQEDGLEPMQWGGLISRRGEAPKAYGTGLSHRSQQWDDCGKVVGVLLCAGKRRGHRTPNSRYMMTLRDRCISSTGWRV